MTSPGTVDPPPRSVPMRIARIGLLVHAGLLWFLLLRFPCLAVGAELDGSWRSLLAHDLLTGARLGVDEVFTYGPLAYLVIPNVPYVAELWWPKAVSEIVLKGVAAFVLAGIVWRRRSPVAAAGGTILTLALCQAWDACLELVLVASVALHVILGLRRRLRWALYAFVAVLALSKFTFLVLALACVLPCTLAMASREGTRRAALDLAVAFASLLAVFFASGQRIGDLGAWLHGALEIARGYHGAMALHSGDGEVALACGGGLVLLACLGPRARGLQGCCVAAVMAALCWIAFKSGVVRQDGWHWPTTFGVYLMVPVLLAALPGKPGSRLSRWAPWPLLAIGGLGMWVSMVPVWGRWPLSVPATLDYQVRWNWAFLTNLHAGTVAHAASRDVLAHALELPRTRALVGNRTIDNLTHQQGMLFLNGLQVRHRPVFQSYSAYTEYLQRRNEEFLRGASGPDFVLLRLEVVDGRPPLMADSGSYLALLDCYRPRLEEKGYLLLERAQGAEAARADQRTGDAFLDEWVETCWRGGTCCTLALEVDETALGRARAFLYQPVALRLEARLASGRVEGWPVAAVSARAPFLLSPITRTTEDFEALYSGGVLDEVVAFRVCVEGMPAAYAPGYRYHLGSRPRPRS